MYSRENEMNAKKSEPYVCRSLKRKLMLSSATIMFGLYSNAAIAQQQTQNNEDENNQTDTITVIGSQIVGASVTGTLPVTNLSAGDIETTGAVSADELFRTLPGAGAMTFGASGNNSVNFGVNGARGDVASVNLRTLGAGNTLVLMNGRRLVDHSGTQTNEQTAPEVTANVNAIPVMGLQRVEILRDGAAALYGTDAVAGVVNNVIKSDYEGLEVSSRYGSSFGTGLDEHVVNALAGFRVNNDKTRIVFSANRFERDGLFARERDYSANSDLRSLVVGTEFEGDTDFRNDSATTPWGQFTLRDANGARFVDEPITQNGVPITSSSGRFIIQPTSLGNCTATLAGANGYCLTAQTVTDPSLRFNTNQQRQMISDSKRINLYSMITTEFENGWEMYTELGYYTAESRFNNGAGNFGPLSHSPVFIPASNYWNPFGAILLDDGTPNPNRLPGLDLTQVPAEGLAIPWSGALGAAHRNLETNRETTVQDESFRIVQGLRGEIGDWNFDTGFVYSESETLDRTSGRISATLFVENLGLNNPLAYNPFNGAGDYLNNAFDGTPASPETYNRYTIDVDRFSKSSLMLADLKISNASLFEMPAGDAGFALGVEFRRQTFLDDRDDRLDGTIVYDTPNPFGSTLFGDVMGSSPTVDTMGDRNVISAFAELAVPLVDDNMEIPFVKSLDVQLAGRFEDFSDIGSVFKPRIATSWYPTDDLQIRGSWALGFRAPNLPQVSEGRNSRQVGRQDFYFCQAAVNKGLTDSLANCNTDALNADPGYLFSVGGVERFTFGSEELKPEESNSISIGAVWQPEVIDGLTLTVDYWRIKQTGIIGLFGTPNHLKLDYALRITGQGSNDDVIRLAPTQAVIDFFDGSGLAPVGEAIQTNNPYLNLEDRVVSGIDMQAIYRLRDTSVGNFTFNVSATKLLKAEQSLGEAFDPINNLNDPNIEVIGGGDLIEQNRRPSWRGNASINWVNDEWDASIFVNYIGGVDDLSASITDASGDPQFWRVDSWTTVNASVGYTFDDGSLEGLRVRLGMNNVFDTDPPLADENFGFMTYLHSARGRYGYLDLRYEF